MIALLFSQVQLPDPNAVSLGSWLINAACVLAIFYMLVKLTLYAITTFRKPRRHGPPTIFATKGELDAVLTHSDTRDDRIETQTERTIGSLRKDIAHLDEKGEERAGDVHSRVNEILGAVKKIEGKIDVRNKRGV